ncbi:squalene/phytoene synthase family protein [Jannaschia sp. 2305UL9-9]|uniref:squalene/phytoene synthase family protein n=1 Tax=Jannaschia sp. 2305UL9-9 TaxID=3121638 RepID=UPI0035293B90
MTLIEDIAACAGIVERGDPDRFAAVMAAPIAQREMLFPLYAFNVEVARAPWVTQEPLIAEMRLQWWRDALEEIGGAGPVRRHEVVTPLAAVLDAEGARTLDTLIEARRADIDKSAPEGGRAGLIAYLDATAGTLLWTAARLAGAGEEGAIRQAGRAQGVAAYLTAVPDLIARSHHALPHGDPVEEMAALADAGLTALDEARATRMSRPARGVLTVMAGVGPVLKAVRKDPETALSGLVRPVGLTQSLRRARAALLGRF